MGLYGMNESSAVKAYDARTPGVNIPSEQKFERMERRAVRERYGARSALQAQRTRATVGTIRIPDGSFWCDCGLFKDHSQECKD